MTQRTFRMVPPATSSGLNPITINGRVYSSPSGAAVDMPDLDGQVAEQNRW
jgi:hypothetical protein